MSHKRKILIVEDDFILFEELTEFFEEKGFFVVKHKDDKAVDNYEDAVKLLKQQEPDIAVLDINIKGDKDGIDLGAYITQHYHIPVIYLSAYNNYENRERIRKTGNERFVIKATKPLDKEQLWATFDLALPKNETRVKKRTLGDFFTVKEMIVTKQTNSQRLTTKEADDPLEIETFLKWDEIIFIESYNASIRGSGNNNVLIHTTEQSKAYMMRSSLTDMEKQLPEYFARFDQSTIVNLNKIDGRNKTKTRYLVGDLAFGMSDTYKKAALEKIARLLAASDLENFPET
jgi:two-component system, LytTR family, response regulator LytT